MSETAPRPRANRDGDPCPPWCDVDHGGTPTHITQTARIDFGDRALDSLWACVILGEHTHGHPVVAVTGHRYRAGSCHLDMAPHRAADIAGLIEMLAGASPEQHRELAEAIRQAAAQTAEASDG